MIYLGVDDTDSATGMCTTYIAVKLVEALASAGYTVIGYPRLVRLNPTIPWKTRGNGAISLFVGRGRGKKTPVAWSLGKTYFGYEQPKSESGPKTNDDLDDIFDIVKHVVSKYSMHENGASPGYVVAAARPEEQIYWAAVQSVVSRARIISYLKERASLYRWGGLGNKRGVIGAVAAIAWPARHKSYEIIAYREEKNIGKPRRIDKESVKALDTTYPETFHNYDYENDYIAIAPNTPCPVLFGVRSFTSSRLINALSTVVAGEPISAWCIFVTNHATDDHIMAARICELRPYISVRVCGKVSQPPQTIRGGHVIFEISDGTASVACAAYEPTKGFRTVVKKLETGDVVCVYGSVRVVDKKYTINIEKIFIKQLAKKYKRINPACPNCGVSMHSVGREQGYRCKKCRAKTNKDAAALIEVARGVVPGWYEVPICARRHLYKPVVFRPQMMAHKKI